MDVHWLERSSRWTRPASWAALGPASEPAEGPATADRRHRRGTQAGLGQDNGAVAVEAALVLPVLLLCLFGIVDAANLVAAQAGWGAAARSAVRSAAMLPRDAAFADAATGAVLAAAGLSRRAALLEVWVYRANSRGYPGSDPAAAFATCATACLRMAYRATTNTFVRVEGSWPPTSIAACAPRPDAVGIRVVARHESLASTIRAGPSVVDRRAVMAFEPYPPSMGPCK